MTNERPSTGSNTLQASVAGEEFVGATAIIHLEASDGMEITAQKSHDELARLDLSFGTKVWVSWAREAGHILPGE